MSDPRVSDTPRIFLYDAYPGGIGFSEPLFGMHADLMERTRELIARCACENGCPTCVGPIGETGPQAKAVALRLLDHLVGRAAALPVSVDEPPF
jgi:DEAD/DEAH box helicase domain-containing protein